MSTHDTRREREHARTGKAHEGVAREAGAYVHGLGQVRLAEVVDGEPRVVAHDVGGEGGAGTLSLMLM